MTANVNQQAGRRESPAMAPCGDSLIEDANHHERSDNSKDVHVPIVTPTAWVGNLKRSCLLFALERPAQCGRVFGAEARALAIGLLKRIREPHYASRIIAMTESVRMRDFVDRFRRGPVHEPITIVSVEASN